MSEDIKRITVEAKNSDEAILKAAAQLNAKTSELEAVEISEVKTGFLGRLFGARKLFNFEVTRKILTQPEIKDAPKIEPKPEVKPVVKKESEPEPVIGKEDEATEQAQETEHEHESKRSHLNKQAVKFTNELLNFMDIDAEAVPAEKNFIEIIGNDAAEYIVGRYGDALKAIEYIVNLTLRDPRNEPRIKVDACGYRERRTKSLERLAEATARQVIKFGRPMRLEPMTSWERWVIHTTLKDRKDVTTESIGEPPSRRVVVTPKYDTNNYKNRKYRPSRRFSR